MRSIFITYIYLLSNLQVFGQSPVDSKVYHWRESIESFNLQGIKKNIFEGNTRSLSSLQMSAWTLSQDQTFILPNPDKENLIIVQQGLLTIQLNGSKNLTPGSVALILPNETISIKNGNDDITIFYLMSYEAKNKKENPNDTSISSFTRIWEEIAFKTHDKGGKRQFFDQTTKMTENFEMHVTTLNGLINSHEPHTHQSAEIMLIIGGNTEMSIGDTNFGGSAGDVYFVESEVLHSIRNMDKQPCMYFAFQWK